MNDEFEDDTGFDDEGMDDQVGRPNCPFCESKAVCEHLIFEYDLSFCECHSDRKKEIDELEKTIKRGFFKLLSKNKKVGFIEEFHPYGEPSNEQIFELWFDAKENYKPRDDSVDFSYDNFMRLMIYISNWILEDGEVFAKYYGSGGDAPGFDSAMVGCFAEDPTKFFKDAENYILEYLQDIEFDSDDAKVYNERGLEKIDTSTYGAIIDFSKAIYLDPNFAEAYFNRGNTKSKSLHKIDAENDYQKALKLDPTNESYQQALINLKSKR